MSRRGWAVEKAYQIFVLRTVVVGSESSENAAAIVIGNFNMIA